METIKGFEKYSINESGEIYSHHVNRCIKPQTNPKGYAFVRLQKDGKQHHILLHRLLAFVFLDLPSLDSELEVDHKDTNNKNNRLDNLQVLTTEQHKLKTYGEHWNPNRNCTTCNSKLGEYNTTGKCRNCISYEKTGDIALNDIIYWVTKFSWCRAGRELGLSDNGVRKRFTKLSGLPPKDIHSLGALLVGAPPC